MEMGGAERALVNVLNLIKNNCEIDLILLEKKGILLKDIPKEVNIKEVKTNLFKYLKGLNSINTPPKSKTIFLILWLINHISPLLILKLKLAIIF